MKREMLCVAYMRSTDPSCLIDLNMCRNSGRRQYFDRRCVSRLYFGLPHIPAGFSISTGYIFSSPNPLNEFSFGGLDFGEYHAIGEQLLIYSDRNFFLKSHVFSRLNYDAAIISVCVKLLSRFFFYAITDWVCFSREGENILIIVEIDRINFVIAVISKCSKPVVSTGSGNILLPHRHGARTTCYR